VLLEANGGTIDSPMTGQSFSFLLRYNTEDHRPLRNVSFEVWITSEIGQIMLHLCSRDTGTFPREIPGEGEVRCTLPRCPLPPGHYAVSLWARIAFDPLDWIEPAFGLVVQQGDFFGGGQQIEEYGGRPVLVDHNWSLARAYADRSERRHATVTRAGGGKDEATHSL
jgi:hypothetical protein